MLQHVYTTYDSTHKTWNAMTTCNTCLFYGTISQLEDWLQTRQACNTGTPDHYWVTKESESGLCR